MIEVNIKLLCKKTYKSLLALMIMFSMFPQFTETVVAEETTLPVEQFATKEQLKTFNTNDNDGEAKSAKVYFGNNNQQWWIAGSQDENSITLFVASPLASDQAFEQNYNQVKPYRADWNCDYTSTGGSNPSDVYPNHYGASPLRSTLKNLEKSYFTSAEQGLMKDTTIYTNDTKNNSVYSTTDKLYLAYGDIDDDQYITVGTNSKDSLNNGLRIDNSYWGNSFFWLRVPYTVENLHYVLHTGDGCVDGNLAIEEKALVPAFELDMSSVIFASTASAATTTGALSINEAFTLRYGMDRKVSALVSYDKSKVTLSGVWPGIKLVVQNKDGANAKLIMMQKEVSATDMGVDTFANCKVWLEYTNDSERKTYATLATEEQGYDVNITASDGLTVTNGVQGVVQGSAITDITVAVADGYYLPNGYTNNIQGLNGLNVKDVTQTGFTISGTPTNDVNIVLEARRDQFVVEGGEKDVDYTYQNGILTFVKDGDYVLKHPSGIIDTSDRVVIANNFNGSLTLDNISINLGGVPCIDVASDANLKLIIRGKNTLGVHSHDPAAIQFMNVAENGSLTIDSEEPVGELNLHGCNGPGLGSPGYSDAYTKNIYIDGGIIDASSTYCSAIGSHNDKNPSEITINGGVVKGGKIGSRDVSSNTGSKVIINGGYIQNNINVEAEINGGFVTGIIEDKEIKNSKGEIVYKTDITLESNSVKSLKVDGKDYNFPTQSGIDKISVYLPQGEHILTQEDYDGNTYEYKVIIGNDGTVKHVNAWEIDLTINGWTYGQNANEPSAKSKFGGVVFSYSDKKDGNYTNIVPSNAGTYYVKATVAETENYTGLESAPVPFEIKKANSSIKFKDGISFNKVYDTDTVVVKEEQIEKTGSTGTVSFTFEKKVNDEWKNVETPTEAGKYRVTATLAGDNNHIPATSKPLEFTISKANSTVTITTQSLNKAYDGKVVATPEYEKTGSDGKVTVKWQKNTGTNENPKWEDLKSAPTNVGKYKVVVTLDGNGNYNSASKELEFTISKTTENTWTEKLSIKGWTYKEQANKPSAKVKFGTVTYTYSDKENGTYTSDVPSNAGTYYVKATVAGNENYTGLESVVPFEIKKADPVLKALNTLTIEEGKTLKSLSLPEGYKWKNPDYVCKDLGTYTYKAVYTPKDSVNYNVLDVEVSVKVIAKSIETSPVVTPSITNNNHNNNNTYVGNGGSTTSSVLNELKEVVNKNEYKANEKAYTKESYDNYLNAYKVAEEALNNKNSSKEEIKAALDKLNEAILSLKVDKANLESSLAEFEKLDADKYSEASYIKLKDALDKAKSVMEDKEASAEEIARAIDKLNEAYSSLQAVEPTVTEPEKTSVGKLALITTVATVTVAGGGSYLWILLKRSRGMK